MNVKPLFLLLGYLFAWFVLLPLLFVVGGITLLACAIIAESAALITGNSDKSLDAKAARGIASRMCSGYGAKVRSISRHPSL